MNEVVKAIIKARMMEQRKESAYHEAGHVVVDFVLGASYFSSVDIFEDGRGLVNAWFPPFRCRAEEISSKKDRRDVIGFAAGCFAQVRYLELLGMPSEDARDRVLGFNNCGGDMQSIAEVLAASGRDNSWRDRMLAESRELVAKYWEYVEKVADKLLQHNHLTHHEVFPLLHPILSVWKAARDSS